MPNSYSLEQAQESFHKYLNINLGPAGIWKLEKGKKVPVSEFSTHRKNNIAFDNYKNDNMAKHYLRTEQNILIVDVDGEEMELLDNGNYYIVALDLTLPKTFHTTGTRANKFHFYYTISDSAEVPARIVKLLDTEVNIRFIN